MIVGLILLAAGISQPATRIISAHGFELNSDRATTAELVERPAGIADEDFAQALIDASGLQPWNGRPTAFPASAGHMGVKSVISGAGPEVTVYYLPSDSRKVGRVCRISRKRGGMTNAWTSAQDWCVSRFGLPPLKRVPPIQTMNEPIHN